jgi:hypothetical protein
MSARRNAAYLWRMQNAFQKSATTTTITEHEAQQVERANSTNAQPVVRNEERQPTLRLARIIDA